MATKEIDWPGLMQVGLGELRLLPAEFWKLTPAEFALLSGRGPSGQGGPLTRGGLNALLQQYPDRETAKTRRGQGDGE